MELKPQSPPGRKTRKARAFAVDIQRLAGMGYSLTEIRDALQTVGVSVSKSTVQREASRRLRPTPAAPFPSPAIPPSPPALTKATAAIPGETESMRRRSIGEDIAQAFFNTNPSTPVLQSQEVP